MGCEALDSLPFGPGILFEPVVLQQSSSQDGLQSNMQPSCEAKQQKGQKWKPRGYCYLASKASRKKEEEEEEEEGRLLVKDEQSNEFMGCLDAATTTFQRLSAKEDVRTNVLDGCESLMIQYLAYDQHRDAQLVLSGINAGSGQVTFGPNRRCKIDCTLIFPAGSTSRIRGLPGSYATQGPPRICPEIAHIQFHGSIFHQIQLHEFSCAQYKIPLEPEMDEEHEDEEEDDDDDDDDDEEEEMSVTRVKESDKVKDKKTLFQDQFSRDYAAALSRVGRCSRSSVTVSYHTFSECELFHRAGGTWSETAQQYYPDIRTLLKKVHPYDSVLGIRAKTMSLKSILTKLMRSDEEMKSEHLDFSGFVCVHGGYETAKDNAGSKTRLGWCLQRCNPPFDELGEFTKYQHSLGPKHQMELGKRCDHKQTMTKTSFHEAGELLGASYLRWLVQDRGLKGYQCSHFLMFRKKNYLTSFISSMLQRRHTFKKTGTNALAAECLKLLLNR